LVKMHRIYQSYIYNLPVVHLKAVKSTATI
jgi:hypothetical protein